MRLKDILNPNPIVESSLKVGSMIFVNGFPILKGLLSSQYYKVTKIDGDDISFQRVNKQGDVTNFTSGTVTHKISSIEASIQNVGRADINGIEIVSESTNQSDIIKDLDKVRTDLIKKVDVLIAKKKKLYSNVDIESPMSADEKQLDKDIQSIFSQIQQIIQQKRKIKESKTKEKVYIDYLNKAKGFKQDRIKFDSYEAAVKWARKNFDKFDPDMIKYESINELTYKEKQIKTGNPANVFYAFYKGKFDVVYWAMNPSSLYDMYWDEFKVRRPAGSQFKLNPEFMIVPKKEYDKHPEHYNKLKPYVDKFWDKIQNESVNEDWSKEYKDSIDCNNPKGFSQKAHCAGKKKNETMLRLKNLLGEAKFETYHNTYTSAINAAKEWAEKQGYQINDDDSFTKIGMGPRKPSEGKTNRFSIEITKDGKPQRKMLHIQVYGMKSKYELNAYIG
jgi:hypothetical protein